MRASAPRGEARFVGVGPSLCDGRASTTKRQTSGGRGSCFRNPQTFFPRKPHHRNGLVMFPILVGIGWQGVSPTSANPTRTIPYEALVSAISTLASVLMMWPSFSRAQRSFRQSGSADPADKSIEMEIVDLYSFCQPAGLLHDTTPTPPSKSSRVCLVVRFVL